MLSAEFLGWLSIGIGLISYLPYIFSILKGETKPHAFSWFVWGAITGIAYLAQISDGAATGAWVTGFSALICFLITFMSFFKEQKGITQSDWLTFITSLLSIPIWYFSQTPLFSVILISLICTVAFFPTYRKSYNKPWSENILFYNLNSFKFVIALFALENWSLITALFPISVILTNTLFVLMLLYRRAVLKKESIHA